MIGIDPTISDSWILGGTTVIWLTAAACVALLLAWVSALRHRSLTAIGWLCVAAGLVCSALIEVGVRPALLGDTLVAIFGLTLTVVEAGGAIAAAGLGVFMLRQAWQHRFARFCLVIALLAALTNPVTEGIEARLVSDPENYTFVAANEPYRFESEPARRLELIVTTQEVSEALACLALLVGLVLIAWRDRHRFPER